MNSFGRIFRTHIFGESHGTGVGITLDGIPAGIDLTVENFMLDMKRRQAGAKGTTPRKEPDIPKILSGSFNDKTTGAPLTLFFENTNTRSKDYSQFKTIPRPGHADFVAEKKFKGFQDYRGGGHFSGRLTACIVAAGVVAKKIIGQTKVKATLIEAGGMTDIEKAIDLAIERKDSIGGIVECVASPMPIGLGEPFFDSVESVISHLVFAIPATKGIEFGSGFQAAKMFGSEHNDKIIDENGQTSTNFAAGINGGISNGNELVFRIVTKPTSSTFKTQKTFDFSKGESTDLNIKGRHDLCIALRVPVVLEAVTAMALADLFLIDKAYS